MRIFGPEGIVELVTSIVSLGGFKPDFDIEPEALKDGDKVALDGFSVLAVAGEHTVPELCYVIEEDGRPGRFLYEKAIALGIPEGPLFEELRSGHPVIVNGRTVQPEEVIGERRPGRKVVISGDTRPIDALVRAAKDADVLVHESTHDSSLEKGAEEYGHSTAKQAAEVAKKANVRSLYLTHISNRYDDTSILLDEARSVFQNTVVAEDFMTIEITYKRSEKRQDLVRNELGHYLAHSSPTRI